jgi:hypothetical protein
MAKNNQVKAQHRSMRGKIVDMDLLRKRNELTPAVGNARVNARGDELGPGGKIIRKADDRVREHYKVAGKVRSSSGRAKAKADEVVSTPEETVAITEEVSVEEQAELEAMDEEWVEDKEGNFVPKSEA